MTLEQIAFLLLYAAGAYSLYSRQMKSYYEDPVSREIFEDWNKSQVMAFLLVMSFAWPINLMVRVLLWLFSPRDTEDV